RNAIGPTWADFWTASDLAYGIAQWGLSEGFVDDNSGRWDINGFRFGIALDVPNNCNATTDLYTVSTVAGSRSVTNLGAKPFNTSWNAALTAGPPPAATGLFLINGVPYVVSSVSDANHLTLSTNAASSGTFTAVMQEIDFQPMVTLTTFMHFYAKNFTDG